MLGFQLSIAQILLSVMTCAVLEVGIVLYRRGVLSWPASALLTGNGVAFILRVPGTRHGDWWSLHGAWIFVTVAAVSLLSKHAIRRGDRHLFNPSNIGLVAGFLVLGARLAVPQDLWWGPMSPGLTLTLVVIVAGGLVVTGRLRMAGMAAAFWATFAACMALLAARGHCMTARWHVGPVCGWSFWSVLVTSPEILVFLFFMISDPKTSPSGQHARLLYGSGVALMAAVFVAPQHTEFATKVGLLAGLTVVSAAWPALQRAGTRTRVASSVRGRLVLTGSLGAAVAAGLAVVLVAGANAPSASAASQLAATGAAALAPAVDPTSVPQPTVSAAVRAAAPWVTPVVARRLAADLATDLVITSDALRKRAPAIAADGASGAWLDTIRAEIDAHHGGGEVAVPTYRFDHLALVLVRDAGDTQAPPQLGLDAAGVEHRETYGSGSRVVSQQDAPCHQTYVLAAAGNRYLIAGVAPA